jgi:chemotaxis protein MotB
MRGLLLVLVLAGGCVPKTKYDAVVAQNAELNGKVDRLEARLAAQREAYQAILADLKPLIDRGVLQVENRDGRVVIGMASDVLFASGSADLSEEGRRTVGDVARLIARHGREHTFQVEGHTDNVPIATPAFPDNWHLGAARAITVATFMIQQGFPADHISAATFGDSEPVASNDSDAGKAKNRRIEIVLLLDLSDVAKTHAGPSPKPRNPPRRPH